MGDGGPLQIACFLVRIDTSSGAIHATMDPDSKKMDTPYFVEKTAKWVRDLVYERFCLHGDNGVLQLLLDNVAKKKSRPEGQDWQILPQVSSTQSHQSNGAAEIAVSKIRGLARTFRQLSKTKIQSSCSDNTLTNASVDDQTRSMDSHEIQREKGHTNDSVREDSWTEYRNEILFLGEQVLARRPGANVNQLLPPWVTGLWLGHDTLSDEHLIGTAAGVMRSRAVRRLQ